MSSSIKDKSSAFRHVNYGWDDDYAATLDPVARLAPNVQANVQAILPPEPR